ncbi:MAG: aminopeptidase P family protein [Anaerolineae bacterium]|nr:aminopeptidase P family protein [Anaerolineae bacterium]
MKSDLDRLMAERELDAFLIVGGETENPFRKYMMSGAGGSGMVIKKRGEAPVVIIHSMEADKAAKSGLQILTSDGDFKNYELMAQYSDPDERTIAWYERLFAHFGLTGGRIGIYGFGELGGSWETMKLLDAHFTDFEFVGEREKKIFDVAAMTKDPAEIALLRDVAARTSATMQAAWDFIAGHSASDGHVVTADGSPLTIGEVKAFVRVELLRRGLEDNLGMIFAQGHDAGVPHSVGEDDDPLRLGEAIVFDLFPRDLKTGYYHDMTRTWCIGHAPEAVQRAYDHTHQVITAVVDALKLGESYATYNLLNYDMMEEFGYETPRSHPGTQVGALGAILGHGVGLDVHERPYVTELDAARTQEKVEVGNVVTIEPGVYYPERGFGIRIEDTVYIDEDGHAVSLSTMHKQLVLELAE